MWNYLEKYEYEVLQNVPYVIFWSGAVWRYAAVCAAAMHLGSGIKMPMCKLPPLILPVSVKVSDLPGLYLCFLTEQAREVTVPSS